MGAEAIATESAAAAEPEVIRVDQVEDLIAPLPEVNKAAIAAEHAPQPAATPDEAPKPAAPQPPPATAGATQRASAAAKPAKSVPAPVDVFGRPFDPRLHETTPDGKPVISTSGKRMGKIRCRRQPLKEYTQESAIGEEPADAAAGVQDGEAPADDAEAVAIQRKAAAATLTGCQVMLMRIALGPAIADEDVEREALVESWQAVLAHHDVRTFNPWLALAITTGGVIAAKVNKPETRSRLQRIAEWSKVKAYALWLRITGRRAAAHAAEPKREAKPEAPAGAA